jgi:hypothetical protein
MGFKDYTVQEPIFPVEIFKGDVFLETKFSQLLSNTDEERLRKAEDEVRKNPPSAFDFVDGSEKLEYNFKSYPSVEMKRHKGYIIHTEGEIHKMYCDCKDFYYRLWAPLVEAGLSSYSLSSKYLTADARSHTQAWTQTTNPDGDLFVCKHLAAMRQYL